MLVKNTDRFISAPCLEVRATAVCLRAQAESRLGVAKIYEMVVF